ncbi:hypothetical protein ABH944_006052 [Caballeronia udeis]|uniref:Uncharacterized protein n=1 Tax=Caballeronia udeis TaxID=1232866 RepID=A0ABW8MQ91_9BURK
MPLPKVRARRVLRSQSSPTTTRSLSVRRLVSGVCPSRMAAFLDQAGGLWMSGALNGKVGGASLPK